ncbi:hypothetical protein FOA52_007316 [Chlamydomonas sp. UWO 241]|nr:hypothetical protein FOA52_007316 [Chlamydomonas sp. UWO 241]
MRTSALLLLVAVAISACAIGVRAATENGADTFPYGSCYARASGTPSPPPSPSLVDTNFRRALKTAAAGCSATGVFINGGELYNFVCQGDMTFRGDAAMACSGETTCYAAEDVTCSGTPITCPGMPAAPTAMPPPVPTYAGVPGVPTYPPPPSFPASSPSPSPSPSPPSLPSLLSTSSPAPSHLPPLPLSPSTPPPSIVWPAGIYLDRFEIVGQTMTFNVAAQTPDPLSNKCSMQNINKIEINTYAACRYTILDAFVDGVPLTRPVFDKAPNSFDEPPLQVIKMYLNTVTQWNTVFERPLNFTLVVDDAAGVRKCPSWQETLNTTGSPNGSPISIAFFNEDRECCALAPVVYFPPPPDAAGVRKCPSWQETLNTTGSPNGSPISIAFFNEDRECCALAPVVYFPPPPPLPPPFPPSPPALSPPPPACNDACTTFSIEPGTIPAPTEATCNLLAVYLEAINPFGRFSCSRVIPESKAIIVCGSGGSTIARNCQFMGTKLGAESVFQAIGYGGQTCGLVLDNNAASCGCTSIQIQESCSRVGK